MGRLGDDQTAVRRSLGVVFNVQVIGDIAGRAGTSQRGHDDPVLELNGSDLEGRKQLRCAGRHDINFVRVNADMVEGNVYLW